MLMTIKSSLTKREICFSCGQFANNDILPLKAILLSNVCDWSIFNDKKKRFLVVSDWSIAIIN